jgi:methyl coenzyme M reductase subunit C
MTRYSAGMSLEDAMSVDAALVVTRDEAIEEVKRHQLDTVDLINELGDHPTYKARAVMEWLGY